MLSIHLRIVPSRVIPDYEYSRRRIGARHAFADHLNDFDLAANHGGRQWSATNGCDALPYSRIFNPVTQSERFDPHGKFIRRYLPELANVPDKFIHSPGNLRPNTSTGAPRRGTMT